MRELANSDIQAFHRLMEKAERIAVTAHAHPDGDALGSVGGIMGYAQMLGKEAVAVLPHCPPETISFIAEKGGLSGNLICFDKDESAAARAIGEADLLVCCDFNRFSRTDGLEPQLAASKATKVLIDHHENPDKASFDLIFSETEISSASELVFHILMAMPEICGDASRIPAPARFALMSGMTTDTNNFANSTHPSTLAMASALLAAGTPRDEIVLNLYNRYRENRLRLMGHFLSEEMEIMPEGVGLAILRAETMEKFDMREGETEGFVNLPLGMENVRMSIFLREDKGHFRVSIRAKAGIRADLMAAKYFHGGGHIPAAGGKLHFPQDIASPSEAGTYVKKAVKEFFAKAE